MPENQASTLELLVGVARGGGPAAAPGRGPAARGDPLWVGWSRASASRPHACWRRPRRLARRGERRVHAAGRGGLADRGAARAAAGGGRAGARRAGLAAPPHRPPRRVRRPPAPGPDMRIAPGSIPRPARVRYDLRPGRPDLARFPRADWVRSLSAAVRGAGVAELDYPPIAGAIPLREVVAAYRGRVPGLRRARRRRDPVRGRRAGVRHARRGARAGQARGRGPGARGHPRALRQARADPGPDPRRRARRRRRRAAGRRGRGPAHARAPVPDRRGAQRRAAGGSCWPGRPSTTR